MSDQPIRPRAGARSRATRLLCLAALASAPLLGHAGIVDPKGDFLLTFGGTAAETDLDVLSASAVFNPVADTFTLSATMDGAPGTTPGGFYVWGVNLGTGKAGFATNGLTDVLFDTVVVVRPGGSGVTISGNTITATIAGSTLKSTGFAEADYQWNLWPRDGAFTGFAAISDFAPNTVDFPTTVAVPEPQTYALMLAGLAVLGWAKRRRRSV